MSRERVLNQVVREFLLNTCRLRPQPNIHVVQSALWAGALASVYPVGNSDLIPLPSGSVTEFYVEPMLPHFGDIDVMFYFNTELAIPRGHPPPTQLPAEFHGRYVEIYEIIDSHLPGYVFLQLRYLLIKNSVDGYSIAVEYNTRRYCLEKQPPLGANYDTHGPAIYYPTHDMTLLSADFVRCIPCLVWPSQAADWPTRHRNYGWPDSATLDHVVSNGCDVVGVAHRQYRQDEWIGKHQWRLSFSRAEIVLINSWMPVQQIVYHMLRVFMKTERLTDCADNSGAGTLSNYHIKTLMLWACELKPRSWWTDDANLVRMCVQLLHILADWLTYARCQHYFINNCNLIDNSLNVTNIGDPLMLVDETWLSEWFVGNYIRTCSQFTPYYISRLFDDVRKLTRTKLFDAVSALVAWRRNSSVLDMWRVFDSAEFHIPSSLYTRSLTANVNVGPLTARSCVYYITELAKIDSRLGVYFTAVACLHVAYRSLRHGLNDGLVDVLATLFGHFTGTRRYPNNSSSVLSLNIAAKLMKVAANKSLSTMSLIETELSKAYLHRALRCKDSDSDPIYCLANVYLAVLYHTTGQYHTAIDHCTLVTRSQYHSQCSSHVRGEILPKIDDDVDNVLGLAVFYQHVRTAALNQKLQVPYVSLFTVESFAYYLRIKCLSVTAHSQSMQTLSVDEFKRYNACISDTPQLYVGDVLLFLTLSQQLKCAEKPICPKPQHTLMNTNNYNASDLVELLQKFAVKHLTTYRHLLKQEFGSVATIVTTDFEALYAYKRGDYRRCLQLSTENVHSLLYAVQFPRIPILPEFIQLMDDDIVSLAALTLVVDPNCRGDNQFVCINLLTLSLYLKTQCQLKLRHTSLTSLARTFECIKVARDKHSPDDTMNLLILRFTERKALLYM